MGNPIALGSVTNSVPSMGTKGFYKSTYTPGSTSCVTNTSSKSKVVTFPATDGTSEATKIILKPGGVATNTIPAKLTIKGTPNLGTTPFTPIKTVTEGIPQDATGVSLGTPQPGKGGNVSIPSIFIKE